MKRSVSHNHRKSFSHIHARYPPLNEHKSSKVMAEDDEGHNAPYLNSPTTANLNSLKIIPRKNTDFTAR